MKHSIFSGLALTTLAGTLILFSSGCTKRPVTPPTLNTTPDTTVDQGKDIDYPPPGFSEEPIEGSLDDSGRTGNGYGPDGQMSQEYMVEHGRSTEGMKPVYYDFDQYTIRPDMTDTLISNAAYLQTTNIHIVIEGNCDDRGTSEYNLALGEKRALSAKNYLVDLGVDPAKIRTVSYGEERPLFLEQNDFAWEHNRRADFVAE